MRDVTDLSAALGFGIITLGFYAFAGFLFLAFICLLPVLLPLAVIGWLIEKVFHI